MEFEQLCLKHPKVQDEISKMELPTGVSVGCDPWMYGTDDINETQRLIQCYLYLLESDDPQTNMYSLPCRFSPVFDGMTKELVRIDYLPSGPGLEGAPTYPWKPVKAVQYAHNLLETPLRDDLKPYIVSQPQGPSFQT